MPGRGKVKKVVGADVTQSGVRIGAADVSPTKGKLGKEAIEKLIASVNVSTSHMGKFTKEKQTLDRQKKKEKVKKTSKRQKGKSGHQIRHRP